MISNSNLIYTISFFLFVWTGLTPLFGVENSTRHSLSLTTSFLNPNFSDHLVSPLHLHGLGTGGRLIYRVRTPRFDFNFFIGGGGGVLYSKNSGLYEGDDYFVHVSFNMNSSYRLPVIHDKGHLLLGLQVSYIFEGYLPGYITSYNWFADLSFLPTIGFEYDFTKGRLRSSFGFSIFSIVNRPPWTNYNDELDFILSDSLLRILFRGGPVTINQYFRFNWDVHWDTYLSPYFDLISGFSCQYIKTTLPLDASSFSLSIDVGIRYVF